jgi:hypothetical protein
MPRTLSFVPHAESSGIGDSARSAKCSADFGGSPANTVTTVQQVTTALTGEAFIDVHALCQAA